MMDEEEKEEEDSQGRSSGDDLDQLLGDDGLPGAVEGQRQLVDHLGWRRRRRRKREEEQEAAAPAAPGGSLQAFLLALSMAVILALCSLVDDSFRAR